MEYQWQKSTVSASSNFGPITGATNTTYTEAASLTQTTWYRRQAKVTCETNWVSSNVIEVTVNPTRRYVTEAGAGLMDGSSWANAFSGSQLQTAINASCVTEVWVAAGTYKPTTGTDRNISFVMKNGVAILGGFPDSGNPGIGDRNWNMNPTILSGNIGNPAANSDNSYHVIMNHNNGLNSSAVLDGFTVSDGYASNHGGGIYQYSSSPRIVNCLFVNNFTQTWGAGIYNNISNSEIINCIFKNNHSNNNGGGVYNDNGSAPFFTNCLFTSNSASVGGGGVANWANVNAVFKNCSFTENSATYGGGIQNGQSNPVLENCILWNNSSEIQDAFSSNPTISYSIVKGGFPGTGNINLDPLFINPTIGDLRLQPCSPAINAGNNASVPSGITTDLDGNPRFYNSGTVDMGAYEYQGEKNINPTNGGTIAANQTICHGATPAEITSTALPSGHIGTLEYQWQESTTSATSGFAEITSATGTTYQPGALTQTTWFIRLAKVACKPDWTGADTSNAVQITVRPEFNPGEIAATGETICYNTNPTTAIGNITSASGGDGTITYSWRSSADGYATDIASATGTTYTPAGPLTSTTSYRRYAKDGSCNTTPEVSTGTWTVTVRPQFTSGEIANTGETICYNTNPATAIGNVTSASGGDGSITYSWRSSADSYPAAISGASSATYIPSGPLTATTSYRRYAKDGTCNTTPEVSTGTWTVTVRPQFTSAEIANTGETICYNTNPTTAIGNTTSASGGDGSITYSWRSSADGYTTDIASATGTTYTPAGPLTSTTSYRRYAKDGSCNTTPEVSTGTWTVTVRPQFTSGEIANTGETICYNTNPATAIGNTTSASGGDGSITYSWRSSADGYTTDITSATGTTYTPAGPLTSTTSYRRYAKDGSCNTTPEVSIGTWTVTVRPQFTSGEIANTGETICYNTNPTTTIGNITSASGGDGSITYLWRSSADSYATDISSATGTTYTPSGPLTATTSYRRYAKDGTCNTTPEVSTGTWTVTVRPQFTSGEIANTGETICYNTNPTTAIGNVTSANGGDGSITYSWRSSADSYAAAISGASSATYTPAGPLTSTTSYRRYAKDGTCNTTPEVSTGTWTVTVSPLSAGGAVTGGADVCYGANSTLLTLSGHTGTVVKWQYSTDNTNWTDISHTQTTYTAENLTVDTWFRAVVESSPCSAVNSDATQITIITGMSISGNARYENNPKTPLNGLKITLKKDGVPHGTPVITDNSGFYNFDGLDQGNYSLEISSSHPSGQWQTWGGVNNTDYLLVSKHIAGTQYLPVNPPVIKTSASVKLPHPAINNTDATAIRQAAKFPTTGWSYFDTTKWVFSGLDASTSLNNIVVGCGDVVRDIRGLCSGDVNGTYTPGSGYKTAGPGLELVHRGTLPLTDEMIFPVRVDRAMELGAMTLFLDFDPSVITVTNVTTVTNGPELWFNVMEPTLNLKPETLNLRPETLNTLQIGWMSMEPVSVAEGQAVILIHARLRDGVETHGRASVQMAHPIRFTLNENPLSELANGEGEIIGGAILEMPEAKAKVAGISQEDFILSVFPNPSNQVVHVDYLLTTDEMVDFTLTNSQGVTVLKTDRNLKTAGAQRESFVVSSLMPGVYMLKATAGAEVSFRKLVVVR